jgi:alpha-tubulin suppressor-like RCC1 family protein
LKRNFDPRQIKNTCTREIPASANKSHLTSNQVDKKMRLILILHKPQQLVSFSPKGNTLLLKSIKHAIPVYLLVMGVLTLNSWAGGRVISFGQSDSVPETTNSYSAISAGYMYSLALTDAGEVMAWAANMDNEENEEIDELLDIPSSCRSGILAISAGGIHSLALNSSGKVIAWGDDSMEQTDVPNGAKSNIKAISAGLLHSLALSASGRVFAWGDSSFGQTYVPSGLEDVMAISAGALHSVALREDGRVFVWGDNSFNQGSIPAGADINVIAISAGYFHTLVINASGAVVAWGDNSFGQCNVPAEALSGVVAISAGQDHSLALKADGTLISWGGRLGAVLTGQPMTLPSLTSISAGGFHSLGLISTDADTNGNGIPDWWEIQNGLDPIAAIDTDVDSDVDGYSDQEEYLTNTDPWDRNSYFRVSISANPDMQTQSILFEPSSNERLYTLEYASDLAANVWRPVSGQVNKLGLGDGGPGIMSINTDKGTRYYRVSVTAP